MSRLRVLGHEYCQAANSKSQQQNADDRIAKAQAKLRSLVNSAPVAKTD